MNSLKVLIAASIVVFGFTGTSRCQTQTELGSTWKGPDMSVIRSILAGGPVKVGSPKPAAAPKSSTVTRFVPGAESGVPRMLAETLGRDAQEKATLTDAFEQIRSGYSNEVKKSGRENDLAAAMTFFIAANMAAYNRTDMVSDETSEKLYNSLAAAMSSTPAFAAMSNAEKVRMHDWLVCVAGFVAATYEDARSTNNAAAMATAADFAKQSMRIVLGIDVQKVSLMK